MDRKLLIVAVAASFACWKGEASVGTCKSDADCGANSTCNTSLHVCQYACPNVCAANEVCLGGVCVAQGPDVTQVTAPTTWSKRSQPITVTAVVDGSSGPGIESATLQIAGQPDIGGTTADTGAVRTYSFAVAGSVQAVGSETPVEFTVIAKDTAGRSTLPTAVGHGQLLIDDSGPTVSGVTVNGGVGVSGIKWFKAGAGPDILVDVSIQDAGSGVDAASLTLVSSGALAGTPTCSPGTSAQSLVCRFSVPLSTVPVGSQRRIDFAVAGADAAGNAVKTNTAALGIDGKPPTITFTISSPPSFADCNGGVSDGTMYCGHDGSHFWRAGDGKYGVTFTVSDVYAAPNDVGSGVDQAGSTCSIAGSSLTCTVTYDSGTSSFSFPANFADATFSSLADGSGTVSVTVNAKDAVGNAANPATDTPGVTRLKWMRSMTGKVDTFKGSPIATSQPVPQVILAGSMRDSLGPLVSLSPDGTVLWRAGQGVTTITNNIAYSSTTKRLYVVGDDLTKMFAYAVGLSGVTNSYNCVLDDGTGTGSASGAPAILAGTPERALVADSGLHRLWGLSGTPGVGCSSSNLSTNNSGAWTGNVNPPTSDGSLIYVGHDTSKLSSVSANFVTVVDAPSFNLLVNGPISVAGSLFFADRSAPAKLFSYDAAALTQTWATSGTALADAVNIPVVVSADYAFASPLSGDGHLHAFSKLSGTEAWKWDPSSTIGNVSAPALDAKGIIYFSSDLPKQLVALKITKGTPDVPSAADHWSSPYKGSTGQKTTSPVIDTTVDGLTTEPVIDSTGVLYFATGTANAKVFALITDSTGPLAPVAGSTWPRVGYDNCNSSNTAFTCQ